MKILFGPLSQIFHSMLNIYFKQIWVGSSDGRAIDF